MINMEKYKQLRESFLKISELHIDNITLNELKLKYKYCINSNRTMGYIKDLEFLIRVLEKRTILRYNNIEPLKYISTQYVKDPALDLILSKYDTEIKTMEYSPFYKSCSQQSGKNLLSRTPSQNSISHTNASNYYMENNENPVLKPLLSNPCYHTMLMNENMSVHIKFQRAITHLKSINILYYVGLLLIIIIIIILFFLVIYIKDSSPIPSMQITNFDSVRYMPNITYVSVTMVESRLPQSTALPTYDPVELQTQYDPVPITGSSFNKKEQIQRKVFLRISEELGRFWRDLARHLNIRESEIDAIESQTNLDLKNKAYEALKIFASRSDDDSWKSDLLRALDNSRRKDIREMVEKHLLFQDK
ncbi:uncharacterized protein LOC107272838 isoform X1 [Cephus cinctus]|uniref:Uncharacterized protein LOC107272838 isoform X1 n=1 Tax=Cephus cinctus TaxID=211228 RepID=A0AAJ7CAC8_CEPCN|nr:uncharacterized protein LOC107272838 isoform X1 [Cephus cinctus]XP_024945909.1 uncharacterized protein LOC107272838 isoform X1 [Cephus cinctus]